MDDESSKLLTFATPFGRFRYKRLPYGIHSASEIFQFEIANLLSGIDGTANSQVDIIIWASSKEDRDRRLGQVMCNIRKTGLKLNKSKCVLGAKEILFLGHIASQYGIKADPAKISAIRDIPLPQNKKEVQRFLGMVNYLEKFVNNLSELTAPLRLLLVKNAEWILQKPQLDAITKIKNILTEPPVLHFYDPSKSIRVSVDASSHGLGAMLEQQDYHSNWAPIAYASRSMTSTEIRYAQIEKETLGVVFACNKFHHYLYGRSFTVYNDHQPLKSIFSKSLSQCPPRIQRFMLHLQKYDFDLEFAPGRKMVVADALSRTHLTDTCSEIPESEIQVYVHSLVSSFPVSENRWKQLQSETQPDPTLQLLKDYTLNQWQSEIDQSVKPYFSFRDEISYLDGVRNYGAASFSIYLYFLFFVYLLQAGVDGWWLRLFCLFVVVVLLGFNLLIWVSVWFLRVEARSIFG